MNDQSGIDKLADNGASSNFVMIRNSKCGRSYRHRQCYPYHAKPTLKPLMQLPLFYYTEYNYKIKMQLLYIFASLGLSRSFFQSPPTKLVPKRNALLS